MLARRSSGDEGTFSAGLKGAVPPRESLTHIGIELDRLCRRIDEDLAGALRKLQQKAEESETLLLRNNELLASMRELSSDSARQEASRVPWDPPPDYRPGESAFARSLSKLPQSITPNPWCNLNCETHPESLRGDLTTGLPLAEAEPDGGGLRRV